MTEKITITSGFYRGRTIDTPGKGTHPMGSRERLALFNMLGGRIEGARVLDAFAGSGSLGIEALSRGATEVIFVEKSSAAFLTIRQNLKNLALEGKGKALKCAVSSLENLGEFDIILADPPYDNFNETEVGRLTDFLKKGGILALSHPGEASRFDGLTLEKSRQYAGATISFYAKD